jgi:signal peptidase I
MTNEMSRPRRQQPGDPQGTDDFVAAADKAEHVPARLPEAVRIRRADPVHRPLQHRRLERRADGLDEPELLEGDRIFVNKLAYDLKVPFTTWHVAEWSRPKRGDVVVFFSPADDVRLVKRVVGLPGDTLELRDNQLLVNGSPANYGPIDSRFPAAWSTSPGTSGGVFASETVGGITHPIMRLPQVYNTLRNYGPAVIPSDNYFMMGDNRDNSGDSRVFGFVERSRIVGRASAVAISLDPDRSYLPRWHRFFTALP